MSDSNITMECPAINRRCLLAPITSGHYAAADIMIDRANLEDDVAALERVWSALTDSPTAAAGCAILAHTAG